MPGKYTPLTRALAEAAARGQQVVDLDFQDIAKLVGALPPSADVRQWWANNSQVQALAWRAAGFHVDNVSLDHRRVRFTLGVRGGTYHDRSRSHQGQPQPPQPDADGRRAGESVSEPVGEPLDVRLVMQWVDAGSVHLDGTGRPSFAALEPVPGLYRMTFTSQHPLARPAVYIGESDNLRRRLAGNYRNPGAGQQTSLRINALLREHLTAGSSVELATATRASVWTAGVEQPLDLTRKASRLLAENAALVQAHMTDRADIANLG